MASFGEDKIPVIHWRTEGDREHANSFRKVGRDIVTLLLANVDLGANLGRGKRYGYYVDDRTEIKVTVEQGVTHPIVHVTISAAPLVSIPVEEEEEEIRYECPDLPVGRDGSYLFTQLVGVDYHDSPTVAEEKIGDVSGTPEPSVIGREWNPYTAYVEAFFAAPPIVELGFAFPYDGVDHEDVTVFNDHIAMYTDTDFWTLDSTEKRGWDIYFDLSATDYAAPYLECWSYPFDEVNLQWYRLAKGESSLIYPGGSQSVSVNNVYVTKGAYTVEGVSRQYCVFTFADIDEENIQEIVFFAGSTTPDGSEACPPSIGFFYSGAPPNATSASGRFLFPDVCASHEDALTSEFYDDTPRVNIGGIVGMSGLDYKPMAIVTGDTSDLKADVLSNRTFWFIFNADGRPTGDVWPMDISDFVEFFE